MKSVLVLIMLAIVSSASPSPWRSYGYQKHKHQHLHAKHLSSSSTAPYPLSTVISGSTTVLAPSTGTGLSSLASPAPSGTAPRGTASRGTAAGTAAGTGVQASASLKPTPSADNSTLLATARLAPTSTSSSATPSGTPYAEFLRGVNIGGWLLLDSVLNSNLLSGVGAKDQWTFDSTSGATSALTSHWDSYFTEADVQDLKSYGINGLKIPIGYWAWDNNGTPYKKGAEAYLDNAIRWAAAAGMKVWIDVSNTDSTGGTVAEVSLDQLVSNSLSILGTIATKYGGADYADTVVGLEIFSCPIGSPSKDVATQQSFASKAYEAVRNASPNPNLQIIMPDAAQKPADWAPTAESLSPTKGMFSVAETMTSLTCECEQAETQVEHIQNACERGYAIAGINHSKVSVYVGEFNPATNATLNVEGWTEDVVTDVRKYVEANLEVFEAYTSGYFFWSWGKKEETTTGVGWGFKDGIEKGYIPKPLNDPAQRKYPSQCDA